jgi:hypothetical protein
MRHPQTIRHVASVPNQLIQHSSHLEPGFDYFIQALVVVCQGTLPCQPTERL